MAVNRNFVTDFSKYEINPSREGLSIATASHTGRAWFYFWIVTHTTLENKYKNLPISFCIFLPSTWVILYHVFHLTRDWRCPRNTLFIQTQLTIMNRKKKNQLSKQSPSGFTHLYKNPHFLFSSTKIKLTNA